MSKKVMEINNCNVWYQDTAVLLEEKKDYSVYKFKCTGKGILYTYNIFDEIDVIFAEIDSKDVFIPEIPDKNIIEISWCKKGRVECEFSDNTVAYIQEGDFGIDATSYTPRCYSFPMGTYEAVTIAINKERFSHDTRKIMNQFSIDIDQICDTLAAIIGLRNIETVEEGNKEQFLVNNIEIKDITFVYDKEPVIEELSCSLKNKTTTAIIGPSGSGKTTLCHLIARFWDIQSVTIMISENDVREYRYDSLLSNITMVFQDVYLFADTIRNNIKFGNPDATEEEIIEISKKACCHEFIMKLPEGYDTVLEENGASLSGGEWQRISIARALLKECNLVILDEATSSIDPENEEKLMLAIKELLKNKTAIIIAHSLNTIREADHIIVIDHGNIVQEGIHNQLKEEEGIYKKFIATRHKELSWKI
ncbi:ABC transporter ATP-binding protein [Anaerocolumna sp. MB42-C2]|uniref:ABC transporter ATP-binding protein n=1 Tax=Anaerocolumna sp. MB42-C2 TaxID=3070997 RepID=UPI0027DFDFD9|nr:ATP-binding cassette domain-containing protein [Anaerocolumna sp. MB42-C2]WMJ88006.1 ATP-binding cassette domain-containing protein [Anaerocolumna sp. MB42-C2]